MRRWITAGTAAVVMMSSVVAVAPAFAAGNQQWSPGQRISPTSANSIAPDSVISADGKTAVAVWQAIDSDGHNRIVSSTAVIAGGLATWSTPKVISGSSTKAVRPYVDISDDGTEAVAVWGLQASNATMSAAASIDGGTASWGTPATVDAASGFYSSDYSNVAISNDGSKAIVPITKANSGTDPIGIYAVVAKVAGNTVTWGAPVLAGTSADTFNDDGGTSASMSLNNNGSCALAVFTTTSTDLLTSASATIANTTPAFGATTSLNPQTENFQNVTAVFSDLSYDGKTALAGAYQEEAFKGHGMLLNTASVNDQSQSWGTTAFTENASNISIDLSNDGSTALAVYDQTSVVSESTVQQASVQIATISSGAVSGGWVTTTLGDVLPVSESAIQPVGLLSGDGSAALVTTGYSTADSTSYSFGATAAISGNAATWSSLTPLLPLPPVPSSDTNSLITSAAALSGDGTTGLVLGTVSPNDVSSSTNDYIQAFTMGTAPTVDTVTPTQGSSHGGTSFTLTGTNFGTGATVTVGGVPATDVQVSGDGQSLTAVTAAHAAGTVDITVTNVNGQSATKSSGFTYIAEPAPTVTAVSPSSGYTVGGTQITITGTGFAMASGIPTVTIGGTPATSVDVTNPTNITAVTPTHAAGVQDVVVTNPDGQSGTGTGKFTYVASPQPAVTGVSPANGPISGGTAVTISGSNFFPGAQVTFNGVPAANVAVANSQMITAVSPAGTSGPSTVTVINVDGLSGAAAGAFIYDGPPAPIVQTVGSCAKLPKKIKKKGTTVLVKKHCRTNAGNLVHAKIKVNKPKHKHYYKVDRLHDGKIRIHTYGKKMKVTVELHAPAKPGYTAYSKTRKYKVR